MTRTVRATALVATALLAAACGDSLGGDKAPVTSDAITAAFATVPLGFSSTTSSYAGDGEDGLSLWLPGPRGMSFGRTSLMGGGLGDAFGGAIGMERGFGGHRGPFGGAFGGGLKCSGAFNAATGRFVCNPDTRHGLTITQSASYKTTAGVVQQAFDTATTNTVNVQSAVTGSVTYSRDSTRNDMRGHGPRHKGHIAGDTTTILTAVATVNHRSERTVTGLASGSDKRTVNAVSGGTESSTGTSSRGNFTSTRTASDTTKAVVIPVVSGNKATYPSAGTVIRVMTATVTYAGATPATATRKEVVIYDGTAVAKVTITTNGVTKTCTQALPRGRLSCP